MKVSLTDYVGGNQQGTRVGAGGWGLQMGRQHTAHETGITRNLGTLTHLKGMAASQWPPRQSLALRGGRWEDRVVPELGWVLIRAPRARRAGVLKGGSVHLIREP
jgi:hypothetical protein